MNEKDKIGTEESNFHVRYFCRWCDAEVLEEKLDKHSERCKG